MKRQLMAEQWNRFAELVLPENCSEIQRQSMKIAFYCGALGVIGGLMSIFETGTESTDKDLQHMEDLHQELVAFALSIKEKSCL